MTELATYFFIFIDCLESAALSKLKHLLKLFKPSCLSLKTSKDEVSMCRSHIPCCRTRVKLKPTQTKLTCLRRGRKMGPQNLKMVFPTTNMFCYVQFYCRIKRSKES